MAPAGDFPCNGDDIYMVWKMAPPEAEVVHCRTCATPWHVPCLARPPETLAAVTDWECPDCSPMGAASTPAPATVTLSGSFGDLIASIRAIEADTSLTEQEKVRRRQALVGKFKGPSYFFETPPLSSSLSPFSFKTLPPIHPKKPPSKPQSLRFPCLSVSCSLDSSLSPHPMAPAVDFPCNCNGICMVCKKAPPEAEVVHYRTCATPWHVLFLARPPETLAAIADWECPDCSPMGAASTPAPVTMSGVSGDLIASIRAVEADTSLTEQEKARRQQALVGKFKIPSYFFETPPLSSSLSPFSSKTPPPIHPEKPPSKP